MKHISVLPAHPISSMHLTTFLIIKKIFNNDEFIIDASCLYTIQFLYIILIIWFIPKVFR